MRPIITLLVLGLLVTATACSGGDKESFRNVDHDKDGKISYEEILFVFPGITQDMFRSLDTDHDGMLSENEYDRFVKNDTMRTAAEKSPAAASPSGNASGPNGLTQTAEPYKGEEVIEVVPPVTESGRNASASAKGKPEKGKKDQKSKADSLKKGEATQYTVLRGDNLSRIAQRFGLSVEDIVRANGNMAPDTLRDGQVLTIPARP